MPKNIRYIVLTVVLLLTAAGAYAKLVPTKHPWLMPLAFLVAAALSLPKSPLTQRLLGAALALVAVVFFKTKFFLGFGPYTALGFWFLLWPEKPVIEFEMM